MAVVSPLRLSTACHPVPQSLCHPVKSMNPTQSVQTYLTTAAESAFVGQAVDMIEHWQGQENLLWRVEASGQEAVVKLYIDAGQVRSRRQYDGQERFFRFGAAPRPLWFDWQPDGLTRPVLVYEWMPGEPLRSDDSTALRASARLLAQVHSADTDGLDRFSPHPISLDYQWRLLRTSIGNISVWLTVSEASDLRAAFTELSDRTKTLVEQALPLWQGLLPAPVHGDVRLENMIEAFGDVTFLDWELFGLGDPAFEVARFLHMSQADLTEDVRGDWLESYLTSVEQPGIEIRVEVYQRLLPFLSTCFLLDGLRDLTGDSDALATYRENLPFLASTLSASLTQASQTLGANIEDFTGPVTKLFVRFSRGIDSGDAG